MYLGNDKQVCIWTCPSSRLILSLRVLEDEGAAEREVKLIQQ